MSKTPAEIYQAMNATNILVAILDSQKKIFTMLHIKIILAYSPKGRGLDLVDDGTLSRERGRLDVMGFLEQVRTSCGPQSLSKVCKELMLKEPYYGLF